MFVQEIRTDLLWLQEADCAEARPYVILQAQGSRQGLPPPVLQVPGIRAQQSATYYCSNKSGAHKKELQVPCQKVPTTRYWVLLSFTWNAWVDGSKNVKSTGSHECTLDQSFPHTSHKNTFFTFSSSGYQLSLGVHIKSFVNYKKIAALWC